MLLLLRAHQYTSQSSAKALTRSTITTLNSHLPLRASRAMSSHQQPRRLAPLDPSIPNKHNAPKLKGIVFDVDGTLCLPQNYMFGEMRAALSIEKPTDILTHINSLSGTAKHAAQESIKAIERAAMQHQQPQPGLVEMTEYFTREAASVRLALCTRNFELPVRHLLETFLTETQRNGFWPVVTRETEGVEPKPSPEGIWACVWAWEGREEVQSAKGGEVHEQRVDVSGLAGLSEETKLEMCRGVVMVGDSIDDMEAGRRAGAVTVLLMNEENRDVMRSGKVDVAISRLDDLIGILKKGFETR